MNFHQDCPCCGRRTTAYTVPMNEMLARAFVAFAEARVRYNRPLQKKDFILTNVQYTMFQKLKHFGLIYQHEGAGRTWDITTLGLKWYMGQTTILTPVAFMGNKTLDDQDLAWATHKKPRRAITVYDLLPMEWKKRADYLGEKRDAV